MKRTLQLVLALLVCLPAVAQAQVAPFVYDGGVLPTGKSDYQQHPEISADKKIVASEWNGVMQDVYDVRTAIWPSGLAHGFQILPSQMDPPDGGAALFVLDGGSGHPTLNYETPDKVVHVVNTGWMTAEDCNFGAETPVSYTSGNGTVTWCRQTASYLTTPNGTQYASDITILPDAGGLLVNMNGTATTREPAGFLSPDAGAQNINPRVVWRLSDFIPNLSWDTRIRVTLDIPGALVAGTNAWCGLTLDNGGAAGTGYGYGVGSYSASQVFLYESIQNNSSYSAIAGQGSAVRIENGLYVSQLRFGQPSGFYATAYNTPPQQWISSLLGGMNSGPTTDNYSGGPGDTPSSWLIGIQGSQTLSSSYPCIIRRMKIEYRL